MALSKLEIQQMLREMNVKFDADESYEELKHRLQQEHHSLWLKSVSAKQAAGNGGKNVIVKKRRKKDSTESRADEDKVHFSKQVPTEKHPRRRLPDHGTRSEPVHRTRTIEKPEPGQPWKPAADGTQPFNRTKNVFNSVLKRAKGCCERCGKEAGQDPHRFELQPYYIQPLSEGGQHSTKNMVALCPACSAAIDADPSVKALKELKRKTRSRLYDTLQVVRKKK
jgi:5-methylcytosine-specific restriction enzyme A